MHKKIVENIGINVIYHDENSRTNKLALKRKF
jgi:hypothetical protein